MFVKCISSGPKNEVKRPSKEKHEEKTQRNAELDEFCKTQLARIIRTPYGRTILPKNSDYPTQWKNGRTLALVILQRGCFPGLKFSFKVG